MSPQLWLVFSLAADWAVVLFTEPSLALLLYSLTSLEDNTPRWCAAQLELNL